MNRVRELRLARANLLPSAYTPEAFASRVGVSTRALQRWEMGHARPRQRMAKRIAYELNVTVEELGFDEPPVEEES